MGQMLERIAQVGMNIAKGLKSSENQVEIFGSMLEQVEKSRR